MADAGSMFGLGFAHDTWDQLSIMIADANYGWSSVEGIANAEGFTVPVQPWPQTWQGPAARLTSTAPCTSLASAVSCDAPSHPVEHSGYPLTTPMDVTPGCRQRSDYHHAPCVKTRHHD